MVYYDAHCHYYNLNKTYMNFFIAAVSIDYPTSLRTLKFKSKNVLKGVGMHPWYIDEKSLKKVISLIEKADFIGEVGIDFKYSNVSRVKQIKIFLEFVKESKEKEKTLNVHAYAAWNEAFRLLIRNDTKRAILHWYNGPIELIKDIEGAGYFITTNPSFVFKEKHRNVLEKAPLDIILTESDGGYVYMNRMLEPTDIKKVFKEICRIKGVEIKDMLKIIERNFQKAFNLTMIS